MTRRFRKNVGVIGLGIIGQRVAENLRRHGFYAFVWNRTPRPYPNFVGSPREVSELCDFVQIFVADDDALLEIMQRIKTTLTPNHVVMAHCTVSPGTMRTAAEVAQRRGAQFLDAPFTGSKNAAAKGELVYYIGGDEATLRQARPVLEASSKEIIEIGAIGDATTIKIATNMITAATVQAAAEALALMHHSGLAAEKFALAMRHNGSNSATLEMKLPLMLEGNFEPHFSVKHMLKDVAIATRLARNFDVELGATDAVRRSLSEELREGRGDADYCSVIKRYFPEGIPVPARAEETPVEQEHPRLDLVEARGETINSAPPAAEATPEPASTRGDEPTTAAVGDDANAIIVPSVSLAAETEPASAPSDKVEEPATIVEPSAHDADGGEVLKSAATPASASTEDSQPESPAVIAETAESKGETPATEAAERARAASPPGDAEEHRSLLSRFWKRGDEG